MQFPSDRARLTRFASACRKATCGGAALRFVVVMGLFAGCVDLTPPWQGARDAGSPGGSGGELSFADVSGAGGEGGTGGSVGGEAGSPDVSTLGGADGVGFGGAGGSHGNPDVASSVPDAPGAVDLNAQVGSETGGPNDDVAAGTDGQVAQDVLLVGTGGGGGGGSSRDASSGGRAAGGTRGGAGGASLGGAGGAGGAGGSRTGGTTSAGGRGGAGGATSVDGGGVCGNYVGKDAGAGLTEGLIAWYPCESAAGTSGTWLKDSSSGHGNDATLVTGTGGSLGYSFAPGEVGNALDLVVANKGYVTLPAGMLASACEATIATWVWVNSNSQAWQRIFDFGKDSTVYMFLTAKAGGSNVLRFGITVAGNNNEQRVDGPAALSTGSWNHVAVVLGPSGGSLFLNGEQVGSNSEMTLRPADLGNLLDCYIGRSQFPGDPYFDGRIDEFRIYDRALSPTEIKALYSGS
jgi:hypothetical protein